MHIYPWQIDPTPPPIDSRSMQHHYTIVLLHIVACTYTCVSLTPLQLSIVFWKTNTPHVSYITEFTYTHARLTPTPSFNWAQIYGKPLHHIGFIYSTMHIYPLHIDPTPPPINHRPIEHHYTNYVSHIEVTDTHGRLTLPPPPIDHISMEDHYTDYVSHIENCTDTSADRPHLSLLQLSIDFWKITYT